MIRFIDKWLITMIIVSTAMIRSLDSLNVHEDLDFGTKSTDFLLKDSNIGFKSIGKRQDTSTKNQSCNPSANKNCVFEANSSEGISYCNMDANKKDQRCPGFLPVYPNNAFCESQKEEGKWINPCSTKEGDIGAGCYKDTDHDCNNKTMLQAEIKYLCWGRLQQRDLRCPRSRGEGCVKPGDADCTTTPKPTTTVTTTFPTTPMKKSNSKLDVATSAPVEQTSLHSHQSSIISLSIGIVSAFVIFTAY